jgi:hypothetical protein
LGHFAKEKTEGLNFVVSINNSKTEINARYDRN